MNTELLLYYSAYINKAGFYLTEIGVVFGFLIGVVQIVILMQKHKLSLPEKCAWSIFILTFNYLGVLAYAIYYKIWRFFSEKYQMDKQD